MNERLMEVLETLTEELLPEAPATMQMMMRTLMPLFRQSCNKIDDEKILNLCDVIEDKIKYVREG